MGRMWQYVKEQQKRMEKTKDTETFDMDRNDISAVSTPTQNTVAEEEMGIELDFGNDYLLQASRRH